MKKTVKINIGGRIFDIDDDAYEILEKYLKTIEHHFSKTEDGKEIIFDIEARISELFQGQMTKSKEVITFDDVKIVVETMGDTENIINSSLNDIDMEQTADHKQYRRLYRNPENRFLGGVCGGIGAYIGIDPNIIRIIFVLTVLFFGTGVLIYFIIWVVVPEALTTAQKLEMKGKKVNISNIQETIKHEFKNVKKNIKL